MKPTGLLLSLAFLSAFTINSKAQTPLDITVNGSYIKTASQGFIEEGSAMVPVRAISEILGADYINWNGSTKKISIGKEDTKIELTIGQKKASVNNSTATMPVPAMLINDTSYAGVRFISEALGANVSWDAKRHTVNITKNSVELNEHLIDNSYTSDDLDWLAKIVHAEAQGEPENGKIAVANVILNRVESKDFPNNVYDVIFDRKYGVQFTPVANGTIHNNPSIECYHAAKKALNGHNVIGNSLYFCNPAISTNFWIANNRPFYTNIGNHSFYL